MEINGFTCQGKGIATKTVDLQLPYFKDLGLPLVDEIKKGTINVDISPLEFKSLNFDYLFEDVDWREEGWKYKGSETFGFIELDAIKYGSLIFEKPGYIYVPHSSSHKSNNQQFEVIAKNIDGLEYGRLITLLLKDGKIIF